MGRTVHIPSSLSGNSVKSAAEFLNSIDNTLTMVLKVGLEGSHALVTGTLPKRITQLTIGLP